jgi:NAD(P)-dependent dehydrogenase (short-subunit alcohol dehydrogenase family)
MGPARRACVCLAPGRALTRMTEATAAPSYTGDRSLQRVPLGRWGTPEETSKLVLLLASDAAGYVTGETLIADGGYVIG